jgi:tetratricopeptide (TPR) repeat protein
MMRRERWMRCWPAVAALLLSAGPATAGSSASEDRAACIDLYKQREYESAAACLRRVRRAHPEDRELDRLLGSTYAMLGQRQNAYRAYQRYLERCPKCMYAKPVRKIVSDYEKIRAETGRPSSIRATTLARARALLDKAEALAATDPDQARRLCRQLRRLLPADHRLARRAAALADRISKRPPRPGSRQPSPAAGAEED